MSHVNPAAVPPSARPTSHVENPSNPRTADAGFVEFLQARHDEEARAAESRRPLATPAEARRAQLGLAVLDDLIDTVRAGRDIDSTSLHLLKIGYGTHPDFREEWHATYG